ncbi:hypothetical protein HAX54_016859, partial [Datura stramonium]|nr:hypothetical protein [Datura stramonium]
RSKEGKNHNNTGTALDWRVTDPEEQTTASGHKKEEGWDFEHLTSEPLMKNRIRLSIASYSQLIYGELGMISSVNGKSGGTPVQFEEPPMQSRSRDDDFWRFTGGVRRNVDEMLVKASLASSRCLDLVLNWGLENQYWRLTTLSSVHTGLSQSSVSYWRGTGS